MPEIAAPGELPALDTAPADRTAPIDHPAVADGQHLARGAAANSLVLIASNFRAVFTFLIARILGEAALGRFGLAFATTDLLSKVGMLGLDNAVVPLVAPRAADGDLEACRHLFRLSTAAAATTSLVVALAAIPAIEWLVRAHGLDAFAHGGSLMLLALPGIALARISTGASRGFLSMRNEFYSRGLVETWVTTAAFVLALALGIRDRAPALAVVAGTTAAGAVAFALASQLIDRRVQATRENRRPRSQAPAADTPDTASILRFSIPTGASSLVNVLVVQADVLLLGLYVGRAPGVTVEAFGIFCAAANIAVGLRKVRQIFDPIFAPIVATRAASADRALLGHTVAGPGRWVLAAQLPIVGAFLLSGSSVLALYGPSFRAGALWLALLAIAHGANTFAGLVETLLMIERPTLNLMNALATVAVQLVAGVILIPRFGVTGAAVAMCLGFTIQGVLRFAELHHVFGWSWPWPSLARPAAAFAVAFVPAAALRIVLTPPLDFVPGMIFLALYAGAWRWMGADPADREIWRRLRRRPPA